MLYKKYNKMGSWAAINFFFSLFPDLISGKPFFLPPLPAFFSRFFFSLFQKNKNRERESDEEINLSFDTILMAIKSTKKAIFF